MEDFRRSLRSHKYILDGHTPVPVDDILEWALWYEKAFETNERVVKQEAVEGATISTVFLSLDHSMRWIPGSKPLLFETMVFKGEEVLHEYTQRYATWGGAEHGHKKTVEAYLKTLNKNQES